LLAAAALLLGLDCFAEFVPAVAVAVVVAVVLGVAVVAAVDVVVAAVVAVVVLVAVEAVDVAAPVDSTYFGGIVGRPAFE